MTLRLRYLRIRIETHRGPFGADIPLDSGLMVIRAENSHGKSTAIKSLLFALGMERMIATRASQAVTSAMRDRLIFEKSTKSETEVLSSRVELEVSNDRNEIVTLTRWVKHPSIMDGLITVTNGPALTSPGEFPVEEYFVGQGSVLNPRGFHRWLSRFIGWEMPVIGSRDGRETPLYMEQVFPLLFVEQRRGWGGIQAQMPYFSGISDVRKRALEFLLKFEAGRRELERQQLKNRYVQLEAAWKTTVNAFERRLSGEGIFLTGVGVSLVTAWPSERVPTLLHNRDGQWISIDIVIAQLEMQESNSDTDDRQTVEALSQTHEAELGHTLERLEALQQVSGELQHSLAIDRSEIESIAAKLSTLRDDERQYKDLVTLERLGSTVSRRLDETCPVCHQELPTSLLSDAPAALHMSPADSVVYIRQQIDMFTVMERDSERTYAAKRERWIAVRDEVARQRAAVRRLRSALTSRNNAPSIAQVADRVVRQQRIVFLKKIKEEFFQLQGELMRLANEAAVVKQLISEIPRGRLADEDRRKLTYLQEVFVQQLREYDFGSFSDERLTISTEDYLPRRDDFDLQADISASDSIRVVWAYLVGLLEVSQVAETNHPGFLVFDEPRQQSAKQLSFAALLRRTASKARGGQILLATSEDLGSLRTMLEGIPATLHVIEGYLLRPVA